MINAFDTPAKGEFWVTVQVGRAVVMPARKR
jgi:hypothetical protein